MVRELKGAPLSIIIALGLVHQRVNQEWIERSTGYSDKSISQALQYLREVELVDETRTGWQLIKENVKQLPLMLLLDEPSPKSAPVQGSQSESGVPISCKGEQADNIPTDDIQLSRDNSDSSKLEEVNPININDSSTDSLNLSTQDGKIPVVRENSEEIRRVLDAAADLFGHEIIGDPCDYADIDRLLGWIAQAFHAHDKVKSPAGLVYWAFHQGKDRKPERKYLDYVDQYLPESFMRASGQWNFEGEENES
jgi:hypothetical protein